MRRVDRLMLLGLMLATTVTACDQARARMKRDAADSVPAKNLDGLPLAQTAPAGYVGDSTPWLDSMLANGPRFAPLKIDSIPGGITCYHYPQRTAMVLDSHDDVGSDIVIRENTGPCASDTLAGDWLIKNEWAEYFTQLAGRWLILDSGTGNQRGVIVYDINTRRKLASFTGEFVGWQDSSTAIVWQSGGEIPRALCPKTPASLDPIPDSLMLLELPAGRMHWAARWRCASHE